MPSAITSAFRIIDLDSAALAGTATIAHPMKEVGTWRLSLHRDERTSLGSIALYVREDASEMLATVDAGASDATRDQTIRRGGYLRLVSSLEEGGVFALIRDAEGARTVWDSRSLEGGDVFAFLPLRPGRHVLTDHLGGAERAVRVTYPDPRANKGTPSVMPEPLRIDSTRLARKRGAEVRPGQGVVIDVERPARFTFRLEEVDDGPADLPAWRAAQRHATWRRK